MPKRTLSQVLFLVVLDAIMVGLAFIFAYYLRFNILIFFSPGYIPVIEKYLRILIFVAIIWLAIFKLFGLYDRKYTSLFDEIASVFGATTLSVMVMLGMLFLYRELWFSRQLMIYAWLFTNVLMSSTRIILVKVQKTLYLRGIRVSRCLIVGAGDMGIALAKRIKEDPSLGYKVVGFIDDDEKRSNFKFHSISVLGNSSQIKNLIKQKKVEEIIIASSRMSSSKILDIITECEREKVSFKIVPGILEIMASRVNVDEVAGIPLITISEIQLRGFKAIAKKTTDLILSIFFIILFSPFFLLMAIAIKLDSRGPVFFSQKRIGKDGKQFMMFKFRSMIEDAEKLMPKLAASSDVEGNIFKMKKDPRITRVGRFLRKTSLDELPQLFNVLIGDMSLVGPRPPLPKEVEKYESWHLKRLRIAPGMTGLWQISGRSDLPFEDMIRYDIYYIENWSLWLDFKIMLMTIPAVVSGGGAY